jgi:hypothetical protein
MSGCVSLCTGDNGNTARLRSRGALLLVAPARKVSRPIYEGARDLARDIAKAKGLTDLALPRKKERNGDCPNAPTVAILRVGNNEGTGSSGETQVSRTMHDLVAGSEAAL